MYKKLFIYIVFTLLSGLRLFSQPTDLVFQNYSLEDGLKGQQISGILQDSTGFIWIGTENGLVRFDGYEFMHFTHNPDDSTSIISNHVSGLLIDIRGKFWVSTTGGLSLFDPQKKTFKNYVSQRETNSLLNNYIRSIYENRYGELWLGTWEGPCRYNYKTDDFTRFQLPVYQNEISSRMVWSMLLDERDRFWVGTEYGGLYQFDRDHEMVRHYTEGESPNTIGNNFIRHLYQDDNQNIWICCWRGGLCLYQEVSDDFKCYTENQADPHAIWNSEVNFIIKDPEFDNYWVGTERGLNYFDTKSDKFYYYIPEKINLSSFLVNLVFFDDVNGMWVGTKQHGINYFNRKQNRFLPNNQVYYKDQPRMNVNALYADSSGMLYVGTQTSGMFIFDPENASYKNILHDPIRNTTINANMVLDFLEHEKDLWIATFRGINVYSPEEKRFRDLRNLNHSRFNMHERFDCLEKDDEGFIWAGMYNNIATNRYSGNDYLFDLIENPDQIISGNIQFLTIKDSFIWTATSGNIIRIHKETGAVFTISKADLFTSYTDNLLIHDIIFHRGDSVFLITNTGLVLADFTSMGVLKTYTVNEGLPVNNLTCILKDTERNYWIGTEFGLSKFDPEKEMFSNYFFEDGLKQNQFNLQSCYIDQSGRAYFGGIIGYESFIPEQIDPIRDVPPVAITKMMVDYKEREITGEITLHHNESNFSFEYAALEFSKIKDNRYKYMLEGYDEAYVDAGKKRYVNYTNIPPGEYTFKVFCTNTDDVWGTIPATMHIRIKPSPFKTPVAYAIYLLIILSVLELTRKIITTRVKLENRLQLEHIEKEKAEEINRLKTRFFMNVSHELRTPLTLIIDPLKRMLPGVRNEDESKKINLILRNAEKLKNLINQLMDLRKVETGNLQPDYQLNNLNEFVRQIGESFIYLAEQQGILYDIEISDENEFVYFDKDFIDKILTNLLSNAFKYTLRDGSVTLRLITQRDTFILEVTDTGTGISDENKDKIFDRFYHSDYNRSTFQKGSGIGLSLTKELIQLMNGSIEVNSVPGKRTTFKVEIPYNKTLSGSSIERTESDSNEAKITALIVEDNFDISRYIQDELGMYYKFISAADGKEGYEKAKQIIPDIIITDIIMPEMDGVELCNMLKTNVITSHIPIIILTSRSTVEVKTEGFEAGADEYITKPFSIDFLKTRIDTLIRQRQMILEKFRENKEKYSDVLEKKEKEFILKAESLILKNLENPDYGPDELITDMTMGKTQFYKKLKDITGDSVSIFIRNIRLNEGIALLKSTDYTVSQIAYMVGFNNPSYFSKCFTERYNVAPTDVRKG